MNRQNRTFYSSSQFDKTEKKERKIRLITIVFICQLTFVGFVTRASVASSDDFERKIVYVETTAAKRSKKKRQLMRVECLSCVVRSECAKSRLRRMFTVV